MRRIYWAQVHAAGCGILLTLLLLLGCVACLAAIIGIVQGWAQ
jgi:hypothetical protein